VPSQRVLPLWPAAIALGLMAVILTELRLNGAYRFETGQILAYTLFFANMAVALFGIWKRQRVAWVVYLILSLALMVLIGASTPISAIWTMAKFLL
jgi:hypothetical protein